MSTRATFLTGTVAFWCAYALYDGPTGRRAEGQANGVTYGVACLQLKFIENVDNNEEDLILLVLD